MKHIFTAALAMCLLCAPQPGRAQNVPVQERVAPSGKLQKLTGLRNLSPDCKPAGKFEVGLVTPPSQGRVTVEQGQEFPNYRPEDPRSKCNAKKVLSSVVYYQSAPGYVGDDNFTIEIVNDYGVRVATRFHVVVR